MVKPALANIDVQIWLHHGKLGKTDRSVCLYHSSCDQGAAILRAIEELGEDVRPAKRTLTFNTRGQSKLAEKMQLNLADESESLRVMNIASANKVVTIHLTTIGLKILRGGLTSWLNGAEDFGISPQNAKVGTKELGALDLDSLELWFWGPQFAAP